MQEDSNKLFKAIGDCVDTNLGEIVILNYDIEEELELNTKGKESKPFIAINHVNDNEFKITQSLKKKINKIFSY